MIYTFDDCTLDTASYELRKAGQPVAVEPQVFELLTLLVANPGRLVTKDEMLDVIWKGRIVSEATLSSRIKAVRQAIGDDGTAQRLIRTVHGRGFRFLAAADVSGNEAPPAEDALEARAVEGAGETAIRLTAEVMARPALLVLPFEEQSGDDGTYFADGLTEELISALSAWRWFPVISANTAFVYRGAQKPAPEIARETGAQYLLAGKVKRAGERVRVNISLIDGPGDWTLWRQRFDREPGDLFQLQDELASLIMQAVEPQIKAAEYHRVMRKPPSDQSAWDLGMRALWHANQKSLDDFSAAERLARAAAERDPGWSFPHALIAFVKFERAMTGWWTADSNSAFVDTLDAANAALAVDPNSWLAHALAGVGELWTNRHYKRALDHLHRAIELNPSASWSYHFCGCIHGFAGDLKAATFNQEKVFKVDPVYPYAAVVHADLGLWAMLEGRLDSALEHIERSLEWDPRYARAAQRHVAVLGLRGDRQGAARAIERLARMNRPFDRSYFETSYPFRDPEHLNTFFKGLTRAGLNL